MFRVWRLHKNRYKTNGAAGYQVAVYKDKKTAKNNKTPILTKKIVKLKFSIISKKFKNRKTLYVRVRAYKSKERKRYMVLGRMLFR